MEHLKSLMRKAAGCEPSPVCHLAHSCHSGNRPQVHDFQMLWDMAPPEAGQNPQLSIVNDGGTSPWLIDPQTRCARTSDSLAGLVKLSQYERRYGHTVDKDHPGRPAALRWIRLLEIAECRD